MCVFVLYVWWVYVVYGDCVCDIRVVCVSYVWCECGVCELSLWDMCGVSLEYVCVVCIWFECCLCVYIMLFLFLSCLCAVCVFGVYVHYVCGIYEVCVLYV